MHEDGTYENPNLKFHKNASYGSRVLTIESTDGRTDGLDEVDSGYWLCERA